MIRTQDLTKKFDRFLAVDRVNLTVGAGEVLALLGPNGAGKTTTVRMLTSVLAPTSGSAVVAGYNVVEEAARVRASVGVLTENHGLYNRMPAGDYLDFFGQIYRIEPDERRKRIDHLLGNFGLADDRHRRIGEYSKGMRQKLSLARALLHRPPVLLLDEPTSAMDPESARLVRDAITELRTGERAIVICTHNLVEAEQLADRIAIIRKGVIIAGGTPAELKDAFLGPPEFEARTLDRLNGTRFDLPDGVAVTETGEDWFRFSSTEGERANPATLQLLLAQGVRVSALREVPRSLEEVYLMVMRRANGEARPDA
ncbi:MAG TPA: ABC transporter ATP-binding protein [Anaerolineales bacterium]|nr:ABC transporter ATP-binding protein [Anaerolineales bacterium]